MKRVALTNYILAMNQLLNLEEIGNAPDSKAPINQPLKLSKKNLFT
jgi:hypothetical protein